MCPTVKQWLYRDIGEQEMSILVVTPSPAYGCDNPEFFFRSKTSLAETCVSDFIC